MSKLTKRWRESSGLLYLGLCAPLVFLLLECFRGAYCDVQLIRTTALQREIGHLRSSATHRAGELETGIELHGKKEDWSELVKQPWLTAYWHRLTIPDHQLYAAVVDSMGRIVLHTNQAAVGNELSGAWYQEAIPEAGFDVVRLQHNPLADDVAAYDIRVPLMVDGQRIGDYHQGLNAAWFDNEVSGQQRDVLEKWTWLGALVLVVDTGAVIVLIALARRQNSLREGVRRASEEWTDRLGKIASGLAHEIRNPLHALRLNLHTLQRSFSGKAILQPDELAVTIAQSNRAIDTLDGLMRDLLQFTTLSTGPKTEVDLQSEIRATLNLMSDDMRRKEVVVHTHFAPQPVGVRIEPGRLRQILVDLLTFAQNNAGCGGSIDVDILRNGTMGRLEISASGPALTAEQQVHAFEPFQAPRETASGLGLALVKHFSEEAGGSACYVQQQEGCRFRIALPLFASTSKA